MDTLAEKGIVCPIQQPVPPELFSANLKIYGRLLDDIEKVRCVHLY